MLEVTLKHLNRIKCQILKPVAELSVSEEHQTTFSYPFLPESMRQG